MAYLKAVGASRCEEAGLSAHYDLVALELVTVADDREVGKAILVTVPRARQQ